MRRSKRTRSRGGPRASATAEHPGPSPGHGGRGRPAQFATASGVFLAGGLALAGCSGGPDEDGPGPAEVLAAYEEAFDGRDFDALRALYADDAVITGHPLDLPVPQVADVDRVMTLERSRPVDAEIWFVDVEVTGDQATFTDIFRWGGTCQVSPGDQVTVENGKITSYTWSDLDEPCDPEQLEEWGIDE